MGQTVWSGSGAGGNGFPDPLLPATHAVGPRQCSAARNRVRPATLSQGGVPLDTPHFFDGAAGLPNADFATGSSVHVKSADHGTSAMPIKSSREIG